jgi:hypothetical protein
MGGKSSITYAIFNSQWRYGTNEILLKVGSSDVTPEDYKQFMQGSIYCPKCFTPLSRSPSKKNINKKNQKAHYKHLPSFKHIPCPYHTIKKQGLNYLNDELTSETEEDLQFKTVKSWAEVPPEKLMDSNKQITYDGVNHDPEGDISEVPLPRYMGNKVKKGSNIETVQFICWNIDKLLNVGFTFPNMSVTLPLKDLLYYTKLIKRNISNNPKLFYGKMLSFHRQALSNRTKIECNNGKSLYLYTNKEWDERKGFNETCLGKFIMFYGAVEWGEDKKPFIMLNEWGTYASISNKYRPIIGELIKKL